MSTSDNEVATTPIFSDDDLLNIGSFDDALRLANEAFGGEVLEADKVLGTGFGIVDEKNVYVGVPFIIMKAEKNASEKGDKGYFYTLHCVTRDGRKVIINDGGVGIADQMEMLYEKHPEMKGKPLLVKKGLRMSSYVHPTAGPSITYYLDTSGVA